MIVLLFALQVALTGAEQAKPTPDPARQVVVDRIEIRSRTTGPFGAAEIPGRTSRMRVTRSSADARYEQLEPGGPQPFMGHDGSYTLLLGDGARIITVDTAKKTYWEFDEKELEEEFGDLEENLEKLSFGTRTNRFDVASLGAGEAVLGYPTTRWLITSTVQMVSGKGPDSSSIVVETVYELAFAAAVAALARPLDGGAAVAGQPPSHPVDGDDTERTKPAMEQMPKGVPIRSVTRVTSKIGAFKGTLVTTTEVTSIDRLNLPAAWFEIPKGYRKVDMLGRDQGQDTAELKL